MTKRNPIALIIAGALIMAGCSSSSPEAISDGEYQTYATSDSTSDPSPVNLTISGDDATFSIDGETLSVTIGAAGGEYVVCPPDTKGAVRSLGAALTLGSLTLTQPAMFGDCGVTSPNRVTIVDLDSVSADAGPFPFGRWIEMCNVTDSDC
jgi:hypothetical protein